MLHPVPHEFDIKEPIKHKTFLINGKIANWKGEFSEVKSTIPVSYTHLRAHET